MVKLPLYMPSELEFDLRRLYMLSILMNEHKDGKCSLDDIQETARLIDSNNYRARIIASGFIDDDKCVRAIDGNDVYLCSLRKPFGRKLGSFDDEELSSFRVFRDNLILRTLIKVKRISAKSAAKRFGVTDRTIRNITKKLREDGRLQVVNNFIVINASKCREMDTVSVPDSDKRAIRAANSYYSSDDRDVSGVYAEKEYVKYRVSHSQGKHEKYYDGNALWIIMRELDKVDNFRLHFMTRNKFGARKINNAMNYCDGKKRRKR